MFPGVGKSGSDSWMFERLFQLLLKRTGVDRTSVVTSGRTSASTPMTLPQWVVGDILKLTTPHEPEFLVMPLMLLICAWLYLCCKWRHCTRRSVMKDVDDAESNNALAMVVEPSEAITRTWHVVDKTRRWQSLDFDVWDMTLPGVYSNENGDTFVCLWG